MQLNLKNIVLNNIVLKVVSCIIAFTFWVIISQSHLSSITIDVPLCFYGQLDTVTIDAPEQMQVTLRAPRMLLNTIHSSSLALHIDVRTLHEGKNPIIISTSNLFLPDYIDVLHYSPSNSVITVAMKKPESTTQKSAAEISA